MEERITIIEGPPPTFQEVDDGWAMGVNESPYLFDLAMTRLRTFNGQALVERCHRAWSHQDNIFLHYRNEIGLEETAPIIAARTLDTDEGSVLLLWVRLPVDEDAEDEDENSEADAGDIL